MRKRAWEALLLLAIIATWQWLTPRSEVPTPCPPQLQAQHEALSRNFRLTQEINRWGSDHGSRGEWVIVRYTVHQTGAIQDVELESCSGPEAHPEIVLAGVRACAPPPVLPRGIRSLHIVELFWDDSHPSFRAGSLERALHELREDGRWIRFD